MYASMMLYADGVVLAENGHGMQETLSCVCKWCTECRLSVNEKKTEIICFSALCHTGTPPLYFAEKACDPLLHVAPYLSHRFL